MTDIEKHQHELNQVGHDFGKKREPYWDYMMRRMREEDAKEKAALDKAELDPEQREGEYDGDGTRIFKPEAGFGTKTLYDK